MYKPKWSLNAQHGTLGDTKPPKTVIESPTIKSSLQWSNEETMAYEMSGWVHFPD